MHANPNKACEHYMLMVVPVEPIRQKYTNSDMGPVGISISGAYLLEN